MIYNDFKELKLSMLGFGTMRLPVLENGQIDEIQVESMVEYALSHGVNYFDTAYPYHDGNSEIVIGKTLGKYPRESYFLATKYPGHQLSETYDPKAVFEEQLIKCGVEYFDFYLLHNVNEGSIDVYTDSKWAIVDYFKEQKKSGRIKHLGFSCHCSVDTLIKFLDIYGEDMEFCQIQLNYLDWTLQDAKKKVEILNERNIPILVMEPVRGGSLCNLSEDAEARLNSLRPEESIPAWGFRFLQGIEGVCVVLSGMSNMAQIEENISTFSERKALNEDETKAVLEIAEGMKDSVPCTGCKYCTKQCPQELDIPNLISVYNDLKVSAAVGVSMRLEFLPEDKQPAACLACGECEKMCPQNINIPAVMEDLAEKLSKMPKWRDICKAREEAAAKLKK